MSLDEIRRIKTSEITNSALEDIRNNKPHRPLQHEDKVSSNKRGVTLSSSLYSLNRNTSVCVISSSTVELTEALLLAPALVLYVRHHKFPKLGMDNIRNTEVISRHFCSFATMRLFDCQHASQFPEIHIM